MDESIQNLPPIPELALGDLYHTVDIDEPTDLKSRKATHQQIVDLLNASTLLETTSLLDGAVTTPNILNGAVTPEKLPDISQNNIIGRITAGSGAREEISAGDTRTAINVEDGADKSAGTHTIWIPAEEMYADLFVGCGPVVTEIEGDFNSPNLTTRSFPPFLDRRAHFYIVLGKAWDSVIVKYKLYFIGTGVSSEQQVVWDMRLAVMGSNDSFTVDGGFSFSSLVIPDDTEKVPASATQIISVESDDMFFLNTASANDELFFLLERTGESGSDLFPSDARLVGVQIIYITNAGNDN